MTVEFGKTGPGPEWKEAWQNPATGDRILFHEMEALVGIDLSARCGSHSAGAFCRLCLPRVITAAEAAKGCIDPTVAAEAAEGPVAGAFPEYLVLVNHMAKPPAGYTLRLHTSRRLTAIKPIYTTKDAKGIAGPVSVVNHTTSCKVCDCHYVRGFDVRLADGTPAPYAKRFWESKLSFIIDGERLVDRMPIRRLLGKKEELFERKPSALLFSACEVQGTAEDGRAIGNPDQWLGYMLPNGTSISVELEDIPGGGGLIKLEVGWAMPLYTTKSDGGDVESLLTGGEGDARKA